MLRELIIGAVALSLSAPGQARARFAAYEGPNAIMTGQGGTKVTMNGVDYWTTGTPPRRYQILGVITDGRYEGWGTRAVGSAKIAKMTLSIGGHALILLDQRESKEAYIVPSGTSIIGGESVKTTSSMQVVKYLDPK